MRFAGGKVAGALFFVAASQFVIGLVVAEALYPGYSVSLNYISDLGVGSSAIVFNSSVFLLGLLIIVGAYFLKRTYGLTILTGFIVLSGVGAIGVGIFTENAGSVHGLVSLIAFLFGGLSCIVSYRLLRQPFSLIAVVLGLMSLGALGLYAGQIYLDLGVGGMERMIVYPILMWGAGFGCHLIASPEKPSGSKAPVAFR